MPYIIVTADDPDYYFDNIKCKIVVDDSGNQLVLILRSIVFKELHGIRDPDEKNIYDYTSKETTFAMAPSLVLSKAEEIGFEVISTIRMEPGKTRWTLYKKS